MLWNWQKTDWPEFTWDKARLVQAEQQFLIGGGMVLGTASSLSAEQQEMLTVEMMSSEALTTSEIEGETLSRESVQSSIRRELGLTTDGTNAKPAEQGIAEMTVDAQRTFADMLTEQILYGWHGMVTSGRDDLSSLGRYRTHQEPMQVVSGWLHKPRVHFEAPPSTRVPLEMARFLEWFNSTGPAGSHPLPPLTRAGIAHLYFVSIHPFEDGNGRVGRAIAEKALSQGIGQPNLLALSSTILTHRKEYYEALEAANKANEITDWLAWFAGITLEAQHRALAHAQFILDKARLLDGLRGTLNERQQKALLRMLREGPDGFEGGLSAGKYISMTGAPRATATRDLKDLVSKAALRQTGELRHTRYHLSVPLRRTARVTISEQGDVLIGESIG